MPARETSAPWVSFDRLRALPYSTSVIKTTPQDAPRTIFRPPTIVGFHNGKDPSWGILRLGDNYYVIWTTKWRLGHKKGPSASTQMNELGRPRSLAVPVEEELSRLRFPPKTPRGALGAGRGMEGRLEPSPRKVVPHCPRVYPPKIGYTHTPRITRHFLH